MIGTSHSVLICSSEHLTLSVLQEVISPDNPGIPDIRSKLSLLYRGCSCTYLLIFNSGYFQSSCTKQEQSTGETL